MVCVLHHREHTSRWTRPFTCSCETRGSCQTVQCAMKTKNFYLFRMLTGSSWTSSPFTTINIPLVKLVIKHYENTSINKTALLSNCSCSTESKHCVFQRGSGQKKSQAGGSDANWSSTGCALPHDIILTGTDYKCNPKPCQRVVSESRTSHRNVYLILKCKVINLQKMFISVIWYGLIV